ncbi:MAG: hypothetical protein Q4G34_11210 [Micrococcus sp.]|nr:hypothetical protein [Micrococcus sp.]
MGAGRGELAKRAALVIWVQSDRTEARRRGIARDIAEGRPAEEADQFWDDWALSEDPHFAADRPWRRAGLFILGTPDQGEIPPGAGGERVTMVEAWSTTPDGRRHR